MGLAGLVPSGLDVRGGEVVNPPCEVLWKVVHLCTNLKYITLK